MSTPSPVPSVRELLSQSHALLDSIEGAVKVAEARVEETELRAVKAERELAASADLLRTTAREVVELRARLDELSDVDRLHAENIALLDRLAMVRDALSEPSHPPAGRVVVPDPEADA